jgi:hypothetical protein
MVVCEIDSRTYESSEELWIPADDGHVTAIEKRHCDLPEECRA